MAFPHYDLWDTHTSLGVMREIDTPPMYWTELLFGNQVNSTDEFIDLEKLPKINRKLAPFVAPMANGRPIYERGSRVARFKPSYIKLSDPVTPNRILKKIPGTLTAPGSGSPMARYNAIKTDILAQHRSAVENRWEWLSAKAVIDGQVTITSEDGEDQLVDFGRAGAHTETLGNGDRWGDADVSIHDWIEGKIDLMGEADFGGAPTRITMGTKAWRAFREDEKIRDLLNNDLRGSDANFNRGVLGYGEIRRVGDLGVSSGLEVYVTTQYYHDASGTKQYYVQPHEVVLSSPAVMGYRCFGMIQDLNAQFEALEMFVRNYIPQGDPAIEHILTQSAPIMVPVNPNATLKSAVVAA